MPWQTGLEWLGRAEYELLLFAAAWFAVGLLDDLVVDGLWLWLRATGRARTQAIAVSADRPLHGRAAILVPAWDEAAVIGPMLAHTLRAWPQAELRIYAGCYQNDPATLAAMIAAAGNDARLRVVVHACDGPTTKADCLNRLYHALREDERRSGERVRSVILHDAEDMVHPAALALLDSALDNAEFVQLPVRPEPQPHSRWVGGHYCDEFAEAHGKAMVVRNWLGAGLPAAGVGCAFARDVMDAIAARRGADGPFAAECLTEDYECGLLVTEIGGRASFLRVRDADGSLVATREFFPSALGAAVRQKTRWLHGISLQGWDRLGWGATLPDLWMQLRDRRAPLAALVLAMAYVLIVLAAVLFLAEQAGLYRHPPASPVLQFLLLLNAAGLFWRLCLRIVFTTREYGLREGMWAALRAPVANAIAIMAGRRAVAAYLRSLRDGRVAWDHTVHAQHPALVSGR